MSERTFACEYCGGMVTTTDPRKRFCSKKHADRSRNVAGPGVEVKSIDDLRHFGKLEIPAKQSILRGEAGFSVVMFDIEATHLKPNVGRILCCSFKPLGQPVYTFRALDPRFKQADVYDDFALASAIRDELEKYDIIVGWNSKMFDTRFVNARILRGGGRTKSPQYHVDGMWSWRSKVNAWSGLDAAQKFALPDNEDVKTPVAWEQWMRAIGWDKKLREAAMAQIEEHCELDVRVLEDVYLTLVNANVVRSIRRDGGVL